MSGSLSGPLGLSAAECPEADAAYRPAPPRPMRGSTPGPLALPPAWVARGLTPERLLTAFAALAVGAVGLTIWLDRPTPVLLLGSGLAGLALVLLADVPVAFGLLLALLPVGRELVLFGGLTMDVPSEPLMLLTLTLLLVRALRGRPVAGPWLRHPITLIIGLQLAWAAFSALLSVEPVHSLKFLLAKTWYLAAFFVAASLLLRTPGHLRLLLRTFGVGLVLTVLWAVIRHAGRGFSFASVNTVIQPFYPNHVIYATTLALFLPYVALAPGFLGGRLSPTGRLVWLGALGVLLLGIVLAYTRATWGAVVLAGGWYLVMRWKLARPALVAAMLLVSALTGWLVQDQHYLRFVPDFKKTVFHGNSLEAHLVSTVDLQDVSGMERVYRWVAAARMINERPWTGSGPSTFYPTYKHFTDKRFRTYVSKNPEHSTTHNYFLLTLAEQGIPGLLLWLALVWWALVRPQTLYHRAAGRPQVQAAVLAAGLSLFIIIFHLTLNELVENDRIGGFFYLGLAILLRAEYWVREGSGGLVSGRVNVFSQVSVE